MTSLECVGVLALHVELTPSHSCFAHLYLMRMFCFSFLWRSAKKSLKRLMDGTCWHHIQTQNSSDDFLSVSTPFFCDFLCLCGRRTILCILSKTRSETGYIGVADVLFQDPTGVFLPQKLSATWSRGMTSRLREPLDVVVNTLFVKAESLRSTVRLREEEMKRNKEALWPLWPDAYRSCGIMRYEELHLSTSSSLAHLLPQMEARLKLQLMSLLPRPVAEDSSWGLFEFDEIGAEFSSIT